MEKLKNKVEDLKKAMLEAGEKEYQDLSKNDLELVKAWSKKMEERPEAIAELLFNHKNRRDLVIKYALAGYWMAQHSPPSVNIK